MFIRAVERKNCACCSVFQSILNHGRSISINLLFLMVGPPVNSTLMVQVMAVYKRFAAAAVRWLFSWTVRDCPIALGPAKISVVSLLSTIKSVQNLKMACLTPKDGSLDADLPLSSVGRSGIPECKSGGWSNHSKIGGPSQPSPSKFGD